MGCGAWWGGQRTLNDESLRCQQEPWEDGLAEIPLKIDRSHEVMGKFFMKYVAGEHGNSDAKHPFSRLFKAARFSKFQLTSPKQEQA